MAGLLPSSSEPEPPDAEPRVIGVDEADAEALLSALSSETARTLFAEIHDRPATPSELADRTGTSLQNAQYHLEKLEDADLIEVVDTRYSEKGREMKIFGPSGAPVVLFAGSEEESRDVRTALTSLLGGVALLGLASVAVQEVLGRGFDLLGAGGGSPTAATTTQSGGMVAQEATTTAAQTMAAQSADVGTAAAQSAGLPPGLLFFVGGALVLALAALWWYASG